VPASGFALFIDALAPHIAMPPKHSDVVRVVPEEGTPRSFAAAHEAASALRAAGFTVDTLAAADGVVARILCGADSRFTLEGAVSGSFEDVRQVITALERKR